MFAAKPHRVSDLQEVLKDQVVHGYANLHEGERSITYNPLQKYQMRDKSELRFRGNAKENWFKNGSCDNVPYIHRQLYRDSGTHKSIIDAKANSASQMTISTRESDRTPRAKTVSFVVYAV